MLITTGRMTGAFHPPGTITGWEQAAACDIDQERAQAMVGTSFLWLEITDRCQLACGHCYADSGPTGSHGAMTVVDWVRVLDEAAALGAEMVQFIGGEPTLHPGLAQLVDHAVELGLAVEVFANLVHVTPGLWEMFSREGVRLACSYYSDDPAQHAAVTGRANSHVRTRANILEALRRSIPLRVRQPVRPAGRVPPELRVVTRPAAGCGVGQRGDMPAQRLLEFEVVTGGDPAEHAGRDDELGDPPVVGVEDVGEGAAHPVDYGGDEQAVAQQA